MKRAVEMHEVGWAACRWGELLNASWFYATTLNKAGGVIIVGLAVIGEGSKNARPWVLRPDKSSLILAAKFPLPKTSLTALLFVVDVADGVDSLVVFVSTSFFEACAPPIAPPTIAPIKTRITRATIARPFFVFQNG
jgi:hypothetical protein